MNISPVILENLKYFITNIIEPAESQQGWGRYEVHRARKWAKYCEKVFAKLKCCGENEQRRCLDLLSKIIPRMSTEELGSILKDPTSALNKALMQNPQLDDDVFQELLNINMLDTPNDNFFQDMQLVAQKRAMTIHLLDSLSAYGCQNLDTSIWIATLKNAIEKQPQALEEVFNNAWQSKNLLGTILEMFVAMGKDAKDRQHLDRLVDKFLQRCIHPSSRILLLHQDSATLAQMSACSIPFFDKFVNLLTKEGALLQIRHNDGPSITWENSPPHVSFLQLTTHWSKLLKAEPPAGELAMSVLQDLANNTQQPVWRNIYASAVP